MDSGDFSGDPSGDVGNPGGETSDYSGMGETSYGDSGSNVDTSMFDAFDTTGYGIDNGNYSDASMPGYDGTTSAFDDVTNFFSKNPFGKFAQSLIGKANPTLGMMTSMATRANNVGNANTRGNALGQIGSAALGTLGGALAGPPGALAGGYMGNQIGNAIGGNSPSYSGPTGTQQAAEMGGTGMNFGTGVGLGLGSLYQNYKNSKETGGQLGTLQNMYGQNSPYAQVLKQQLERRDAAGGRRSQYGPREVELQAALANAASRNAPAINQLLQMRGQQRGQNLSQLAGLYQQMGGYGGIRGGLQNAYSGLGGMFTGMNNYDTGGYGLGNSFDTGSFNDVLPDVWG